VSEQKIPFELRVPNKDTLEAIKEADEIATSRMVRFSTANDLINDIEKNTH
jgi:DNA-damage-inducible protein J